jgi:pimeloyl-ACP methyl ester carboxylesterase
MSTDTMNQRIELEDGRHLGFAEFGAPAGVTVFHFHGSAGSRLERPSSDRILTRLGIRFISVDRPGQGLSDFQPGRRLLDWPQDICQLSDQLGIRKFYVEGYSAGGPHALACAFQFPDRVIAGAAISSVAPMSRPKAYAGMPVFNQILAKSSRQFPWITYLIRRAMRGMVMGDLEKTTRTLMSSIPETDKASLYSAQNLEIFASSVREGFRCGSQGIALDDILVNGAWGFDPKAIKPRIDIWHGDADVNVPVHAGKYLQHSLPNCRTTFVPSEGHFLIFKHWEEILSALVNEE